MSDPPRICDAPPGSYEAELLAAMKAERPDARLRARTALALAGALASTPVGAAAASKAATLSLKVATGSSTTSSASAAKGALLGGKAVHAWLAAKCVVAAVGAGLAIRAARPAPPPPFAEPVPRAVAASPRSVAQPHVAPGRAAIGVPMPPPAPVVIPAQRTPHARTRVASVPLAAVTPAESGLRSPQAPGLAAEVNALADVRSALLRGAPDVAAERLAVYGAMFPAGALADEAHVLRIEVRIAQGDLASARRLLTDYGTEHPDGPYAARLRGLSVSIARAEDDSRIGGRPPGQ